MAKSNAQRQREWRERQKKRRQCAYGGCGEPVEPPATLCAEHLRQAREKRAGQVRQLRAENEALRLENAELLGRIAELKARHAEASELGRLQRRYGVLLQDHRALAGTVMAFYRNGLIPEALVPPRVLRLMAEIDAIGGSAPPGDPAAG